MVLGFALFTAAIIYLISGFTGRSIADVIKGNVGGGKGFFLSDLSVPDVDFTEPTASSGGGSATTDASFTTGGAASLAGSPRDIIDREVLPLAKAHGMTQGITPAQVDAANARHGPTVSGNRSDHQGPPNQAWAADMSNGTSMTPEMEALFQDIAKHFGFGKVSHTINNHSARGFKMQLIYGCSDCGGNHTNHVHFGLHRA